jgi:hypothetical protein
MPTTNRVTLSIPSKLDLRFRQFASTENQFKRGWYGKAIINAIKYDLSRKEQLSQIKEHKRDFTLVNIVPKIKVDLKIGEVI